MKKRLEILHCVIVGEGGGGGGPNRKDWVHFVNFIILQGCNVTYLFFILFLVHKSPDIVPIVRHLKPFFHSLQIGGLQPTYWGTDNNALMYNKSSWTNQSSYNRRDLWPERALKFTIKYC